MLSLEREATVSRVAEQYERYPYPRLPWAAYWLAKPLRAAAHPIAYEWGQFLRTGCIHPHTEHTRILVAGCGAYEPLVVAQAHPRARIVAVDLSEKSLAKLKRRALFAGLKARLSCVQADLHEPLPEDLGSFDYVVCTGVVHHSPAPELMLAQLSSRLKPHGLLRLMMYAAQSRIWVYELQRYFAERATPATQAHCAMALASLARGHPFRSTFENYSDARERAGLVDGFFHAHDQPLAILDFRGMTEKCGLRLAGFGHAWHSQPQAFARALAGTELAARYQSLDAWERLATLDDLGELAVNPVFWLAKELLPVETGLPHRLARNPAFDGLYATRLTPAPLLAPLGDELMASASLVELEQARDLARFIEGGWLLGDDGVLPPALARNRCEARAKKTKARISQDAECTVRDLARMFGEPETRIPSPIRVRVLLGLNRALSTLSCQAHELPALARALEPRAARSGADLPWLSTGDLVRDLLHRFDSPAQALAVIRAFVGQSPVSVDADAHAKSAVEWFVER